MIRSSVRNHMLYQELKLYKWKVILFGRSHLNVAYFTSETLLLESSFLLLFSRKEYNLLMKFETTEVFLSSS